MKRINRSAIFILPTLAMLAGLLLQGPARAGQIEALHSWDGEFDAIALGVLRRGVSQKGHAWRDFTVVGGGGNGMATALLHSRVLAGNPPSLAHIRTPAIAMWAQRGALGDVNSVATAEHWDDLLPAPIQAKVKHNGHYVAVPVNVHRINWMWINRLALKRAGARIPSTWEQFFDTAEKLKRAGFIAVAHGGEQWQDHMLFQIVALGVGGGDFYIKALHDFDPDALSSPTMEHVLRTFRRIKQYTGSSPQARRWSSASRMLIDGTAGMQFMGDWAKPVFVNAQERDGWSFECAPVPGSSKYFLFSTDAFAIFRKAGASATRAQLDFASVAMSKSIQTQYNQAKGSTPVRLDVDVRNFDRCGLSGATAYRRAARSARLIASTAPSARPELELALPAITSEFWRDDRISPARTMSRLVQLARRRP